MGCIRAHLMCIQRLSSLFCQRWYHLRFSCHYSQLFQIKNSCPSLTGKGFFLETCFGQSKAHSVQRRKSIFKPVKIVTAKIFKFALTLLPSSSFSTSCTYFSSMCKHPALFRAFNIVLFTHCYITPKGGGGGSALKADFNHAGANHRRKVRLGGVSRWERGY